MPDNSFNFDELNALALSYPINACDDWSKFSEKSKDAPVGAYQDFFAQLDDLKLRSVANLAVAQSKANPLGGP